MVKPDEGQPGGAGRQHSCALPVASSCPSVFQTLPLTPNRPR